MLGDVRQHPQLFIKKRGSRSQVPPRPGCRDQVRGQGRRRRCQAQVQGVGQGALSCASWDISFPKDSDSSEQLASRVPPGLAGEGPELAEDRCRCHPRWRCRDQALSSHEDACQARRADWRGVPPHRRADEQLHQQRDHQDLRSHPGTGGQPLLSCSEPSLTLSRGPDEVPARPQFNSTSLNRHMTRTYNFGNGIQYGGDGFVEV